MDKKTMIWLAVAMLAGVVLAPKLRQLPGVSKLPTL